MPVRPKDTKQLLRRLVRRLVCCDRGGRQVNAFAARPALKRNMKRGETSRVLRETRAPVLCPSRFMVLSVLFIGGTALKQALISYFTGIGMKCETRGRLVK